MKSVKMTHLAENIGMCHRGQLKYTKFVTLGKIAQNSFIILKIQNKTYLCETFGQSDQAIQLWSTFLHRLFPLINMQSSVTNNTGDTCFYSAHVKCDVFQTIISVVSYTSIHQQK